MQRIEYLFWVWHLHERVQMLFVTDWFLLLKPIKITLIFDNIRRVLTVFINYETDLLSVAYSRTLRRSMSLLSFSWSLSVRWCNGLNNEACLLVFSLCHCQAIISWSFTSRVALFTCFSILNLSRHFPVVPFRSPVFPSLPTSVITSLRRLAVLRLCINAVAFHCIEHSLRSSTHTGNLPIYTFSSSPFSFLGSSVTLFTIALWYQSELWFSSWSSQPSWFCTVKHRMFHNDGASQLIMFTLSCFNRVLLETTIILCLTYPYRKVIGLSYSIIR